MTPQEKAKDLIRQFYSIGAIECKQCALIHVGEMIKKLVELSNGEFTFIHDVQYYQEVKQELEKL
jgi:Zn-finger protein